MPLTAYTQPKVLDQLLGSAIGCVRTAIAAAATAQTTINTGSTATGGASGNMDVTPAANSILLIVSPGTGATQNQYSKATAVTVTSATATALTIASQSFGPGISVGDFIFQIGTTTTQSSIFENTVYVGLSTVGAQTSVTAASDLAVLPQGTINVVATTGAGSTFPASGTILVDSSITCIPGSGLCVLGTCAAMAAATFVVLHVFGYRGCC